MTEQSPTVRHRRLARQLRQERERAGVTMERAAAALGWSRPKLVRFETAKTRPRPSDVEAMLDLYGGDEAMKLALVELAKHVRKRGWWSAFNDVLTGSFAELEDDAGSIRTWQVQTVPGLLQTSDYALAVIRAGSKDEPEAVQLRRLQARMARKAVLERQDGPQFTAVLDEALLRRPVGGASVMARQLDALADAARKPNVSLRVLPASAGEHSGLNGSFVILGFEGAFDPDVVYVGGVAGEIFIEDVEQVARCTVRFDWLTDQALSEDDSLALIEDLAEEYRQSYESSR
ncbi:XRE family transcriptional regulator [Actinomadura logoneensis]|uniref:XRE family transcriptional regulator n=1 Tax=Actinomadura logoneensis TaxID=2293572 RepID=A0A372JS44_9ACTN|nr:helix-turn-helix transcriptional regulator [Actinomadura logoneensis]RFU42770.1 XRE family transcriptional regulator [Actinomadura logoneensis]